MKLVCSSSSDNDFSVQQSLAALDPLESSSRHPCRQDPGGWRRGAVGYDVDDDANIGRRTLTTSPASAAQRYAAGEAGNDRKVSTVT